MLTTPGPSVGPDAPSPLWQPLGGLSPQRVRSQVRPFPPVMVVMEDTPVSHVTWQGSKPPAQGCPDGPSSSLAGSRMTMKGTQSVVM